MTNQTTNLTAADLKLLGRFTAWGFTDLRLDTPTRRLRGLGLIQRDRSQAAGSQTVATTSRQITTHSWRLTDAGRAVLGL